MDSDDGTWAWDFSMHQEYIDSLEEPWDVPMHSDNGSLEETWDFPKQICCRYCSTNFPGGIPYWKHITVCKSSYGKRILGKMGLKGEELENSLQTYGYAAPSPTQQGVIEYLCDDGKDASQNVVDSWYDDGNYAKCGSTSKTSTTHPSCKCNTSLENNRNDTLLGITKHQFAHVDVENQLLKVVAINEMISGVKFTEDTRTIIVVGREYLLKFLGQSLKKLGFKFAIARQDTSKETILKEFLVDYHLLIIMKHVMCDCYFGAKVHLVINFECYHEFEYVRLLGLFKKVDIAFTFADSGLCEMLLRLQNDHKVVFERVVPSEFLASSKKMKADKKKKRKKKKTKNNWEGKDFKEVSHYAWSVGGDYKINLGNKWSHEVGDYISDVLIVGGTSVIFLDSDAAFDDTFNKVKEMFVNIPELVITDEFIRAESCLILKQACVYVCKPECIHREWITKNVNVVINFDIPSEDDPNDFRLSWWHEMDVTVIHMATDLNWFELFDMQNRRHLILADVHNYLIVTNLLRFLKFKKRPVFKYSERFCEIFKARYPPFQIPADAADEEY